MHRSFSYIKPYDVRGLVPDELDEEDVRRIGAAFVHLLDTQRVLLGRDMRVSSPRLADAFSAGVHEQGAEVVDLGLVSVDMVYYASGAMALPGAMITASHNPGEYNGIKFCRALAAPFGAHSGLDALRETLLRGVPNGRQEPGTTSQLDVTTDFGDCVRRLVPLSTGRPLRVVMDAGNGVGGLAATAVLDDRLRRDAGITVERLYFEPDGGFPNHPANPLEPENLTDLRQRVVETGADLGVAFDGDADRCFVVDERGEPVTASTLMAWLGSLRLDKHPGAVVAVNAIASRSVRDAVEEKGGSLVRGRAGHSFMKELMSTHDAVFGGEHAGHYYFREFWNADSGILAALHVLAGLRAHDRPLSAVLEPFVRYRPSGELSIKVQSGEQVVRRVREHYHDRPCDWVDGLSLYFEDESWFSLRVANTEPVVRLNVESRTESRTRQLLDEILRLIEHQHTRPGSSSREN